MTNKDLKSVTSYLEEHGGRLIQSVGRTRWPSGRVREFVWLYTTRSMMTVGITALDAIQRHMARTKTNAKTKK